MCFTGSHLRGRETNINVLQTFSQHAPIRIPKSLFTEERDTEDFVYLSSLSDICDLQANEAQVMLRRAIKHEITEAESESTRCPPTLPTRPSFPSLFLHRTTVSIPTASRTRLQVSKSTNDGSIGMSRRQQAPTPALSKIPQDDGTQRKEWTYLFSISPVRKQ